MRKVYLFHVSNKYKIIMGLIGTLLAGWLILVVIFVLYIIYNARKRSERFKRLGVPDLGARFTQTIHFFMGQGNIVEMEEGLYNDARKEKGPMVAVADLAGQSMYFITDLELIKAICVKDFDHFFNRRPIMTKQTSQYFKNMLFNMESEQWKGTRAKISPCFTTGKIRRMFQIFQKSSERMDAYLKEQMSYPNVKSMDMDFLDLFSKYAMDVIASCAFGVDSKSFEVKPEERSVFEQMGRQFGFRFTGKVFFKILLMIAAPKVADFFGIDAFDVESQTYFANVIKTVMTRRRETGERQDDFLQLLMDVQQGLLKADEEANQIMNGTVSGDQEQDKGPSTIQTGKVTFDDDRIIANEMAFLMAGFDPTQSALLFTVYSLALEPEVQDRLHAEVKAVLDGNGGQLSYDAINEMKYLDMVLNECMRFYTPATRTERSCAKDYAVPGTNLVIEKGALILVPIHGIHHDPQFFPNPKKFIPERFSPENKAARHPYAFMPFGHGPRNCIGNRFAVIKVKAVLAQLVYKYHFAPCSKTKIPIEFDRNPNVKPKGGMWLNVTVREED